MPYFSVSELRAVKMTRNVVAEDARVVEQTMFDTSNFGTAELRHQAKDFGTKFDWNLNFGTVKK